MLHEIPQVFFVDTDHLDHFLAEAKCLNEHDYDLDENIRHMLDFLEGKDIIRTDVSFEAFERSPYGSYVLETITKPSPNNTLAQLTTFKSALAYLYGQIVNVCKYHYSNTPHGYGFKHVRYFIQDQRIYIHNTNANTFY